MSDLYIRYPGNAATSVSSSAFPLLAPDGTAAAPSYSFSNSAGLGLYRAGADILGFATAGVTAGNISAAQLWTIGASGSSAVHALNGKLSAFVSQTDPAGGDQYLLKSQIAFTSAPFASTQYAVHGLALIGSTNNQNWTNTTGDNFVGVSGELQLASNAATGTVTSAAAMQARLRLSGTGMTFTRAFGFQVRSPITGSTITSLIQTGIAAASGATNNINLWMGYASGDPAPSGNYNIYQNDFKANLFSGPTAIAGTTTNDSAASGFVGELISANSAGGIAPAASATFANVASISLTAGDWDVEGFVNLSAAATLAATQIVAAISTTSAATDSTSSGGIQTDQAFLVATNNRLITGARRISLASTTTVYLIAALTYTILSTTTYTSDSFIRARRVR